LSKLSCHDRVRLSKGTNYRGEDVPLSDKNSPMSLSPNGDNV
jgi:hypothetical protein